MDICCLSVSVSNHYVRLRGQGSWTWIILCGITQLQVHSSQNDVERAQSFVADALCDGGALDWEHKKCLKN